MTIDHKQASKAAEPGDNVFGDAVAEMAEVGVAAEILKGRTASDGLSGSINIGRAIVASPLSRSR